MMARPKKEWHEDMGPVLWWKFPITEPPYVGTPLDAGIPIEVEFRSGQRTGRRRDLDGTIRRYVGGWPGYHTHFTLIDKPEKP